MLSRFFQNILLNSKPFQRMGESSSSQYEKIDYSREDVDYDSTNEEDDDTRNAKRARKDLAEKPRVDRKSKSKGNISVFNSEQSAEEGRRQRYQLSKLNAYDRHKQLINTYQVSMPCLKCPLK